MVRIDLAPDLVEEAVFHVVHRQAERGDPRAVAWLEQRERIYSIEEAAAREQAFRMHALEHFRTLHLDDSLRLGLESCPTAAQALEALFVRRARRQKEESAELYRAVDGSSRAVLALRPERFLELEPLFEFVRRELLYVDDMFDAAFGYEPDLVDRLPLEPGRRDVVRERVSRAWKQRVEARVRGDAVSGRFSDLVDAATSALSRS
jgi:hypothetical protein